MHLRNGRDAMDVDTMMYIRICTVCVLTVLMYVGVCVCVCVCVYLVYKHLPFLHWNHVRCVYILLGAGSLWVVCLAVVHIRTHRHVCSLQSIQVYILCLYTTYICTYLSTCTVTTALCAWAHGQGSMLTYKVHVHTWCRVWWTVWATRTALDDTVFL